MKQTAIPSAGFSAKTWCCEDTDSTCVGVCTMPLASMLVFKAVGCGVWFQASLTGLVLL